MTKRVFELCKQRIVRAYRSGDEGYDRLMDDASVGCSGSQWQDILSTLDSLHQEARDPEKRK